MQVDGAAQLRGDVRLGLAKLGLGRLLGQEETGAAVIQEQRLWKQ